MAKCEPHGVDYCESCFPMRTRSQMRRISIQNPQMLMDEIELLRAQLQQKGAEVDDWKRRRQIAVDVGRRSEIKKKGDNDRLKTVIQIYRGFLVDVLESHGVTEQLQSVDKRAEDARMGTAQTAKTD